MNTNLKKTEELSITVNIAERAYKVTIDRDEEESVRKAAKRVNSELEEMEKFYKNKNKQDLLAMIALLNTTELVKNELDSEYNSKMTSKLEDIDSLLLKM